MKKRDPFDAAKGQITGMLDTVDHRWLKALEAKKRGTPAPPEVPQEEDSTELLAALESA